MATRCLEACFAIRRSRWWFDWLAGWRIRGSLGYKPELECLAENRQLIGKLALLLANLSVYHLLLRATYFTDIERYLSALIIVPEAISSY